MTGHVRDVHCCESLTFRMEEDYLRNIERGNSDESEDSWSHWDSSLDISSLGEDYRAGIRPQVVAQAIFERIEASKQNQPSTWIHLQSLDDVLLATAEILERWPDENDRPPLWGIPFSVKDSIDVAGIPTTVGCPAIAFIPSTSASIYQKCIDAGGIFIGKTNMEQLATGMTGCRSPYGTLHSTFSNDHIVGGSSSGSAVSVSEGLVSFSLGSDTAGSIRIPALFNGLVGFKPTKGTVSAKGVFPACLHHDCVSFLTLTIKDAETVWNICKGYDKKDLFAKSLVNASTQSTVHESVEYETPSSQKLRFRFGTPPTQDLAACSSSYRQMFSQTVQALQGVGGKLVDLDWAPFAAANELLYGSFVLERLTTLPEGWFEENKQLLHPVTRQVLEGANARQTTAVDLFRDLHRQAEYKRTVEDILKIEEDGEMTVMVVPTAPSHPMIDEVEQDPLGTNTKLGTFAHFANVLDLVGIAIPCGAYEKEDREGNILRLPFGITILAGCGLDLHLLNLSKQLEDTLIDLGQD